MAEQDASVQRCVLFSSSPQKGANSVGKLYAVDYMGQLWHEVPLPTPFSNKLFLPYTVRSAILNAGDAAVNGLQDPRNR